MSMIKKFKLIGVGIVVATLLLSLLVIYLETPTEGELITQDEWCVEHVYFNGDEYYPRTLGLKLDIGCAEKIRFKEDLAVTLPGFNTYATTAYWHFHKDSIVITYAQELDSLYN